MRTGAGAYVYPHSYLAAVEQLFTALGIDTPVAQTQTVTLSLLDVTVTSVDDAKQELRTVRYPISGKRIAERKQGKQ